MPTTLHAKAGCGLRLHDGQVPSSKSINQWRVALLSGIQLLEAVRSLHTVTAYDHSIPSLYAVIIFGHAIRLRSPYTVYYHFIRSLCSVTPLDYGHSIRSLYTGTLNGHWIRSHSCTVTLFGHSIRSLNTVTIFGSVHTVFLAASCNLMS